MEDNKNEYIMYIYKTTNLINNKIYVGQHRNKKDKKDDYIGSGTILKRAIKKYGIENFKKEIIEECLDCKQLCEKEIYWIDFYNSTDNNIGYNITKGGEFGDTLTNNPNRDDIIKKMSDIAKLKIGCKNNFYGKKHTPETKEKISEKNKGKQSPFFGKSHSKENIEKFRNIPQTQHKKDLISEKAKDRFKNGFINPMSGKTGELSPHYIFLDNDIKNKIIQLYINEKMTIIEISTKLNIKYNKVREIINKNVDKSQYHNRWNRNKN